MSRFRSAKIAAIVFLSLALPMLIVLSILSYAGVFPQKELATTSSGTMKVHFIDVGQADSTFVEFADGQTMLIDAATDDQGDKIVDYIENLGYETIDYVVATHAHADHIGGMAEVFASFDVKSCYTTKQKSSSKTYKEFVSAVEYEGIELQIVHTDDIIVSEDNLEVEVTGPFENEVFDDLNDSSLVLKLSYFENDFLITGDAGHAYLDDYDIGDIEVLQVSHHGSYTGTSRKLLEQITPEYAVISAGAGNSYGHPHKETMDLLQGVEVYRTDLDGDIVAVCSKNRLAFE